jgi:Ca2+-binding EF-hand superfamily protein
MSGTQQLTPEEETKMVLEIFDPKRTGYVDLAEMEGVLIANGFMAEKDIILKLFAGLDLRGTGRVASKDIPRIFNPAFVDIENSINIKDAFGYFDNAEKGLLNSQDLISGAAQLGVNISEK